PGVGLSSGDGGRRRDDRSSRRGVDQARVRPVRRLASQLVQAQFSASLASVDGSITLASQAKIPATDEGLLRGDGAFEVIRVYDGKPFALERHLQRLERSALNLRLPLDLEAIRADANRLLAHAGAGPDHELLRIVITRGGRRLLLTEALQATPDRITLQSITYSPTRVLAGVRSLSYAGNMLASRLRP